MSEPLEKLQNRILSDAKAKVDEVIREAEASAERILDDARLKAKNESNQIIIKANLEAEAIRRSILSSKIRANRMKILDEKNRIVQGVIKSVESKLSNISTSPEFSTTAQRLVSEAVKAVDSEDPIIKLGFKDASKKSLDGIAGAYPKGSKLVHEETPIEGLGGVVASDADGRVIFNNSFKSRLERLDSRLLTLISSTIFSE